LHPGLQRTGVDGQSIPSNNVRFNLVSLPETAGRIACAFRFETILLKNPLPKSRFTGFWVISSDNRQMRGGT
jgi:hypothetical protein